MERLTKKRDRQNVIPLKQNGETKWAICSAGMGDAPTEYLYGEHADRLAAYEDTGLEPEEVNVIAGLASENCAKVADKIDQLLSDDKELEQYRALGPIDRLRELKQADDEGRCVVLPSDDYTWTIRGDIVRGIIEANCWAAKKEAEAALRREQE